jgi:hypothetical protein
MMSIPVGGVIFNEIDGWTVTRPERRFQSNSACNCEVFNGQTFSNPLCNRSKPVPYSKTRRAKHPNEIGVPASRVWIIFPRHSQYALDLGDIVAIESRAQSLCVSTLGW